MDNYCNAQIRFVEEMPGFCVLKQVKVDTTVF